MVFSLLVKVGNGAPGSRSISPLSLDLVRGKLGSVVENMGAVLKRCAISTNSAFAGNNAAVVLLPAEDG